NGGNSYSQHLTPFLGTTYGSPNSHQSYEHHSGYVPQTGFFDSNLPIDDESLYLSSSNSNAKQLNNTDTEGESINTLLPSNGSNAPTSRINMAPLISTRLSTASSSSAEPIEMLIIKQQQHQSPRSTVAESFARIQNAVHATPPVIATHLYRQM
ncbi:hypothetical protein BLA29_003779, partial [Euroglyphus maynei]